MQFAHVNNERTAPSPKLVGSCPACGAAMIAKCGSIKVHHWAHRGARVCDIWWERETLWHRNWKSKFPEQWREIIQHDRTGAKHIADVRTEHGLTIEFQHSHLNPMERAEREAFYGNMIWVVDGARLSRDLPRFAEGVSSLRATAKRGRFTVPFPDEVFPKNWLTCSVPVFFDFGDADGGSEPKLSRPLWCLLPGRVFGQAVVLALSREAFLFRTLSRPQPIHWRAILEGIARELTDRNRLAQAASLHAELMMRQLQGWRRQEHPRRTLRRTRPTRYRF